MTKAFVIVLVVAIALLAFLIASIFYLKKVMKSLNEARYAMEVASNTLSKCVTSITSDLKSAVSNSVSTIKELNGKSKITADKANISVGASLKDAGFTRE